MTPTVALWAILIITFCAVLIGGALAASYADVMRQVRQRVKDQGLLPLGYLIVILNCTAFGLWFYVAAATDQWLLFAIPATATVGNSIARAIARSQA